MATGIGGNGGGDSHRDGGDGIAQPGVIIETPRHSEVVATGTEEAVVTTEGGGAAIEAALVTEAGGIDPRAPNPEGRALVVEEAGGLRTVAWDSGGSAGGTSARIEAAEEEDGGDRLAPGSEQCAPVVGQAVGLTAEAVMVGGSGGEVEMFVHGGGVTAEVAETIQGGDRLTPGSEQHASVMAGAETSPLVVMVTGDGDAAGNSGSGVGTATEGTLGSRGPFEVHGGPTEGDDDGGMEAILEEIERDPSRGKQPMDIDSSRQQGAEEACPDPGAVVFIPPTGSSSQRPVYQADFAEFIGEEKLAELGRTNPSLVGDVLQMRQEHVEGQVRRAEEIRLVMEREASARRRENAERVRQEAAGPRVIAVWEAMSQGDPSFTDGVPNLPEVHLIVPRGFEKYKMARELYSDDQGFRDRESHLRAS